MSQLASSKIDIGCLGILLFSLLVFGQLINYFTETRKTFINIAQFLESLAVHLRVFDSLAASKVNDVKSGGADNLRAIIELGLRSNQSSEDRVGAWRLRVHVSRCDMSVVLAPAYNIWDFFERGDVHLSTVLEKSESLILSDVQSIPADGVQQVKDRLVIYLNVGAFYLKVYLYNSFISEHLLVIGWYTFEAGGVSDISALKLMSALDASHLREQVFKTTREKPTHFILAPRALYRECLATARLPISKNTTVVAMEALIDDIAANIVEYFSLGGLLVRYVIEVENLRTWL